jgi:protein O-mannosyl-transferase
VGTAKKPRGATISAFSRRSAAIDSSARAELPRRSRVLGLAAVAALALALHGRTVGFGFTYLDDDALVLDQQSFLARPAAVAQAFGRRYAVAEVRDHAYYRPLTIASLAIDAQWSKTGAHGYHLTNVLLHALAAVLIVLLLRRLGHGDGVALWGGLVFAAHPALAEAVAWIPGRNDLLLVALALASWLLFLGDSSGDGNGNGDAVTPGDRGAASRWPRRAGHLGTLLLALFTKEAALVLPVIFVAHLRIVERRPWRAILAPWLLVGWAAVLAVYLAARAAALGGSEALGTGGVSVWRSLANLPVLLTSFGKLVLPVDLAVLAIPEDTALWPGIVAALALAALLLGAAAGARRAAVALAAAAFVLFTAPSLPASSLLVLESRLYLPAVAVVLLACEAARRVRLSPGARRAAGAVVVAALAMAAFAYSGNFRDRLTFCQAAARGSPHSSLAHRNLGVAHHLTGDDEAARREYEAALAEDAGEPVANNNLAVILMARGRLAEAEPLLRRELDINRRYLPAHRNLARVLGALGRTGEALPHWKMVLELEPTDAEAARAIAGRP